MKNILLAGLSTVALMSASAALADGHEIKIGVLLSFSGPIESLTPAMAAGAELAMTEVSNSGLFLDGKTVVPVRADATCSDVAAATAAAERLVSAEGVAAIVGSDCSGTTIGVLNNVAMPQGIVMVSPASTTPALSTMEDDDLFFRTAPSDALQGVLLADLVMERGINEVAVTFTNNDYGQGFADAFVGAYEAIGGTVTLSAPHEDGRGDYAAEVGALSAAGGDALVVLGYVDQGGLGVIRSSIDAGAFGTFVGGDGMLGQSLIDNLGEELESWFGTVAGAAVDMSTFEAMAAEADINMEGPYVGESYDAAALILLAMAAGGEATSAAAAASMNDVANAPGEPITAGELARGLEILAAGGEIDYVGATGVEFRGAGEPAGSFNMYELVDGSLVQTPIE